MNQVEAKKILQELVRREDLGNKICADCSNPNPQWASLSFAVFICLQCAGVHRGFGVHIRRVPQPDSPHSFVRSISMDTWQEEQIKRMQLGGNKLFREFMRAYQPVDYGGYSDGLSPHETYHCWAATQYRQKLDSMLAGQEWSPSPPTPSTNPTSPTLPSSQGLRKSRTSSRAMTGSSLRSDSSSPASFNASPRGTPDIGSDQKAANETYFSGLGSVNASRPDNLPPSQGGRYQGFGSTPSPSSHPSYGLSSASAPTFNELQDNPMAALSKGWSLFSAAVVGASRAVNENVIQPGMEKVSDPTLQSNVRGYLSEAQKRAAIVGSSANQWSKNQFGVDVAESVGGVVGGVRDRIGGPSHAGYGSVPQGYDGETSALYHDHEDDDAFFGQYSQAGATTAQTNNAPAAANKKKDDWDDDWKDF
ncbi:ArfGap-domain-containing protein [Hymenopellis radicata]|nr:ArfGap-domain-containing protein [Hymenopellis radicata]